MKRGTGMKRSYTLEQYRADVTKLYHIRKSDAPGVSQLLADALAADAELADLEIAEVEISDIEITELEAAERQSEEPPPVSLVQRRKPPELGG
jgi:hypothetical protein